MVLKSNVPDRARITSSASAAVSPFFLSTRPSVSVLPTLPSIVPGGPIGAGAAALPTPAGPGFAPAEPAPPAEPTPSDRPGGASGRDGTIAIGVADSASRLIAP